MADRVTKICHITKFPLVSLISASPSDKARTVKIMVPTASGILSDRVLLIVTVWLMHFGESKLNFLENYHIFSTSGVGRFQPFTLIIGVISLVPKTPLETIIQLILMSDVTNNGTSAERLHAKSVNVDRSSVLNRII